MGLRRLVSSRLAKLALGFALFFLFFSSGCVVSDGAEVAEPRPSVQPESDEVSAQPELGDLQADRRHEGILPPEQREPREFEVAEDLLELTIGDFTCLGDHLPAEPRTTTRTLSGRTVYFGTDVAAPGVTVRAVTDQNVILDEAVSDDRGRFQLAANETPGESVSALVVERPGFVTVRYASTHPGLSFGGDSVDGELTLGAVKPADVAFVEALAEITVEDNRGTVLANVVDCSGVDEVSGVRFAIQGETPSICYATSRMGLSCDLDRTTSSSLAYLFNLEPGAYELVAWGFLRPGAEGATIINRTVVEVAAGELTVVDVHPE